MTKDYKDLWLFFLGTFVILTLPFTKGLTLNIGFPLKIYEVILVALVPYWMGRGGRPCDHSGLWWPLAGFLTVALLSLVINFLGHHWNGPREWPFPIRFGPLGDGVVKWFYSVFVVGAFFAMCAIAKKEWMGLTNAWLLGAGLAATVSLYYALSSGWGGKPMLLPGLERHQTILFLGRRVIRSGCFHEGNFAALYFLLSISLSLHRQKVLLAFFLSLACLSTFSSLGVLGCVLIWCGSLWSIPRVSKKSTAVGAFTVGLTIVFLQSSSGYLSDVITKKLLNDKVYNFSIPVQNFEQKKDSGSLGVRVHLMKESLRLWSTSPFFGIGPSQFGYQYKESSESNDMERAEEKPIPNNVYLEILAETGILGFLAMAFFSFRVFWTGWRRAGWSPLFWGVVTFFLGLNTFPSFSVLFIWMFLVLWVESPFYGKVE